MDIVAEVNGYINKVVWDLGLVGLICIGVALVVLLKAFQFSHIGLVFKKTIGSLFKKNRKENEDEKSISPFQAICTSLAAAVGTGNVIGVSVAIVTGGAGAIFWMWIAALIGMIVSFAENILGIYFRRKNENGEWVGGPMYYLRDGLGKFKRCKVLGSVLAILFCIFTIIASFGIGCMAQANQISNNLINAFPIEGLQNIQLGSTGINLYQILIGVVVAGLIFLICYGGIKRIAKFADIVTPIMVGLFLVGSIVVICFHIQSVPEAFKCIFVNAFSPKAVIGGGIGAVILQGFKKGTFSNESGLGSIVMVNVNSNIKEPVEQGMWGILLVFIDTIVICSITALVVLTSGLYNLETGTLVEGVQQVTLVAESFDTVFSWAQIGSKFVAICMLLFAFSTMVGWNHYGSTAVEYLCGKKLVLPYRILYSFVVLVGAFLATDLVWDISDTFNALMMMPNLVGIIALIKPTIQITRNYILRVKKNSNVKPILTYEEDPEFAEMNE